MCPLPSERAGYPGHGARVAVRVFRGRNPPEKRENLLAGKSASLKGTHF